MDSRPDPLLFRLSTASVPTIAPTSSVVDADNQVLASTLLHYRAAEDEATLTTVDTIVEKFNKNLTDFQPTLAIVATWQISRLEQGLVRDIRPSLMIVDCGLLHRILQCNLC